MSTRFDTNKRPPYQYKIELHSPTCKTTQSLSPLTKPIYLFSARRRCRLQKQRRDQICIVVQSFVIILTSEDKAPSKAKLHHVVTE